MGLDMYLYGEKYFFTNWANPEENQTEDGFKVKEKKLEIGYWRKHPNLHGYIVNNFNDGVDNCDPIEMNEACLRQTIEAIKSKSLPVTSGFFFGVSDEDDDAPSIEILEKALNWLTTKETNVSRSVIYKASW